MAAQQVRFHSILTVNDAEIEQLSPEDGAHTSPSDFTMLDDSTMSDTVPDPPDLPSVEDFPMFSSQADATSVLVTGPAPVTSADVGIVASDENLVVGGFTAESQASVANSTATASGNGYSGPQATSAPAKAVHIPLKVQGAEPRSSGPGNAAPDARNPVPSTQIDVTGEMDVDMGNEYIRLPSTVIPSIPLDLVDAIKGLYRILDLVSEPGSGGLGALSFIAWFTVSLC